MASADDKRGLTIALAAMAAVDLRNVLRECFTILVLIGLDARTCG
jgi:hypothetical protein